MTYLDLKSSECQNLGLLVLNILTIVYGYMIKNKVCLWRRKFIFVVQKENFRCFRPKGCKL